MNTKTANNMVLNGDGVFYKDAITGEKRFYNIEKRAYYRLNSKTGNWCKMDAGRALWAYGAVKSNNPWLHYDIFDAYTTPSYHKRLSWSRIEAFAADVGGTAVITGHNCMLYSAAVIYNGVDGFPHVRFYTAYYTVDFPVFKGA